VTPLLFARADTGWRQIDFAFSDFKSTNTNPPVSPDSTLANIGDILIAFDYASSRPTTYDYTFNFVVDAAPNVSLDVGIGQSLHHLFAGGLIQTKHSVHTAESPVRSLHLIGQQSQ